MCQVVFINWVHRTSLVKYYNLTDQVILDVFAGNCEWKLFTIELFSRSRTFEFFGPDKVFQEIGFSLALKRVSAYYGFNMIAPVLLLTLLSCLVYVMPVEAGEKVGLQITSLLSFSVMLLVMGETMPKAGKTTPVICAYVH